MKLFLSNPTEGACYDVVLKAVVSGLRDILYEPKDCKVREKGLFSLFTIDRISTDKINN